MPCMGKHFESKKSEQQKVAATHELGGPVLDEVGDVVDAELQDDGLWWRRGWSEECFNLATLCNLSGHDDEGSSTFLPLSAFLPATTVAATSLRRLALSCLVSGLYLGKDVNNKRLGCSGAKLNAVAARGCSLVQHLEQLCSRRLVERAGELRDGRRGLQAVVQDGALALQPDVLGPLHVTAEVANGLQVVADGEGLGGDSEQSLVVLDCCGLLGFVDGSLDFGRLSGFSGLFRGHFWNLGRD